MARAASRPLVVDPLEPQLTPIHWLREAKARGVDLTPAYRGREDSAAHAVRSGAADVAFGRVTAADLPWQPGAHRRLVLLEPLHVLVPVDHAWAGLSEVALDLVRDAAIWFPMEGAPAEWRDLVAELAGDTGMRVDVTGAALGYDYWSERVAAGSAPPSLVGAEMALAPGLRSIPLVDPTPVYPWWAVWRTGVDPTPLLACTPMGELAEPPRSLSDDATVWMPATDRRALAAPRGEAHAGGASS